MRFVQPSRLLPQSWNTSVSLSSHTYRHKLGTIGGHFFVVFVIIIKLSLRWCWCLELKITKRCVITIFDHYLCFTWSLCLWNHSMTTKMLIQFDRWSSYIWKFICGILNLYLLFFNRRQLCVQNHLILILLKPNWHKLLRCFFNLQVRLDFMTV